MNRGIVLTSASYRWTLDLILAVYSRTVMRIKLLLPSSVEKRNGCGYHKE